MKVSVIVPVYNAERYLKECLDSIVKQTLQDIEIICVNDGSTDGSLKILEEYARKDSRIIVLSQENKTAGAARNKGMEVATGRYFSFLDADDFFEPDMLEKAYKSAVEHQAEIVVYRSNRYDEKRSMFTGSNWTVREELLPDKEVFSHRDMNDIFYAFMGWAWDKLFDAEYVKRLNLKFQEQQSINDLFFVYSAMANAKRIHVIDKILIHKRTNNAGAITTEYTQNSKWRNFYNAVYALKNQLQQWNIYEELKQDFVNYALYFTLWNLDKYISIQNYQELYETVKQEYLAKLDIVAELPEDYFWRKDDYKKLLELKKSNSVEYRWLRRLQMKNGSFLFPFELVDKESNIVLYGAGAVGIEYYRQIKYSNYCTLAAWVDKNYHDKGSEVQNPEILNTIEYDKIVIAMNEEKTAKAIRLELKNRGILEDSILWRQAEIELGN